MNSKISKSLSTIKLVRILSVTSIIIIKLSCFLLAQTTEDSTAVFKQFKEYERTFNTRDPVALSKFFTEDADFVMGNLPKARGRQAIENWWRAYFARQEPGRKGTFLFKSVR